MMTFFDETFDEKKEAKEANETAEAAEGKETTEAEAAKTAEEKEAIPPSLSTAEDADPAEDAPAQEPASAGETAPEGEEDGAPKLAEVVGIRFRTTGKTYYFDPEGAAYPEGSHAVVETARGMEYGEVALANRFVKESELVAPLRPVLRMATPEDEENFELNRKKEREALESCAERFEKHDPPMKLIDTEYTFDRSKLFFYFTADGRVDFRELVRDLGAIFHCRIELRQMGIRDEAKALGGLGICGRPFCCHSFLPDFVQVSIKMAKEQSLSLNAAKISGACGRLMCCLRYEYDTYLEEGKRTPAVGSTVHTRDGDGVVVEAKPLTGMVKVRPLDDPDAAPRVYPREEVFPGRGKEAEEAPSPVDRSADRSDREKQKGSVSRRQKGDAPEREGKGSADSLAGEKEKREKEFMPSSRQSGRKKADALPEGEGSPADDLREEASAVAALGGDKSPRRRGRRPLRRVSGGKSREDKADGKGETPEKENASEKEESGRRADRKASKKRSKESPERESEKSGSGQRFLKKGGERGQDSSQREGEKSSADQRSAQKGKERGQNPSDREGEKSSAGQKTARKGEDRGQDAPEKEGGKGYTVISGSEGRVSRPGYRFHGRNSRRGRDREDGE